jgi:hypothetical protein
MSRMVTRQDRTCIKARYHIRFLFAMGLRMGCVAFVGHRVSARIATEEQGKNRPEWSRADGHFSDVRLTSYSKNEWFLSSIWAIVVLVIACLVTVRTLLTGVPFVSVSRDR